MSSLRALLLDIAMCSEKLRECLRENGFASCFVDEDWMSEQVTPDEWSDYLCYRREYAKEVLLSRSPASIEHSDPGAYAWQSPSIAERVKRRFDRYGPAGELYSDSKTRHLIRLTVPQQRLSEVLERATADDVEQCEFRFTTFDQRRARERKYNEGIIASVRQRLSSMVLTPLSLPPVMLDLIALRAGLPVHTAAAGGDQHGTISDRWVLSLTDGIVMSIQVTLRMEGAGSQREGAIFCKLFIHQRDHAERREIIRDDGFVHFHWILPDQFDAYSKYDSLAGLIVCCAAWVEVIGETLFCLARNGWLETVVR